MCKYNYYTNPSVILFEWLTDIADGIFPLSVVIVLLILLYFYFGNRVVNNIKQRKKIQNGELGTAYIVSIIQTRTVGNRMVEAQIILDIEDAGGHPRSVEIKQLIDIAILSLVGERVYIITDPRNPANIFLPSFPTGAHMQIQTESDKGSKNKITLDSEYMRSYISITPRLRKNGILGIATIAAVKTAGARLCTIVLEVDHVGHPLQQVTIVKIVREMPAVGTRTYILTDPEDPDIVALVPPCLIGGRAMLPKESRVDPLVLGPQLLRLGMKAQGTILALEEEPMFNPALASIGFSKWLLTIQVVPENETPPYQVCFTTSFVNKEKSDKIARVGAIVPLRYDSEKPDTILIDSVAMGYPDPYKILVEAFEFNRRKTTATNNFRR